MIGPLGNRLILLPPGKFVMGSPSDEEDRYEDEDQVEVTLTRGFWLDEYPVTQSDWIVITGAEPWHAPDVDDAPSCCP